MWVDWEFLPRKTNSAGALLFNEQGELLVVKPNYKKTWNLPGGIIDKDESPAEACVREIKEELGLDRNIDQLIYVQYMKRIFNNHDSLRFIFWGGVVTEEEIENIVVQEDELTEYRFIEVKRSKDYLSKSISELVELSISAAEKNTIMYSELLNSDPEDSPIQADSGGL